MSDSEDQSLDAQPKSEPKTSKIKLRKNLPTDRATVSKQFDVLRAAAAASGPERRPVSNDDVARVVNIHFGTVSNCNPFFLESGLISRQKLQNLPCEEVFAYAESYKWDADKAAHKLAPVLRKAWFCTTLLPKLAFRSLSIDEAVRFLAEEAGATPDYKDQLAMLVEYMRVTGIVSVDGNTITLIDSDKSAFVPPSLNENPSPDKGRDSNNSAGSEAQSVGLDLDPLLLALLQKIPTRGQDWPMEKRLRWLKTFAMNVSQVYDEDDDPIEFKIEII